MPPAARILIVDDEPDFTELFKQNLEDSGNYEVTVLSDPKKAVETARDFRPDLIFVDVVMPGMDGGDVVMALKAEPILARKPILMLTALIEEEAGTDTGESTRGGLTFISKTTALDKILAIIEKHLAG